MKKYSSKKMEFRPTKVQEDRLEEIVGDKNFCYSNAIQGKSDILRVGLDEALKKFSQEKDAYNFRREVG
mgnify:CR=1 FL=1